MWWKRAPVRPADSIQKCNTHIAHLYCLKAPLLASLRMGKYTLYNDEAQEIEQMVIYATFEHRNHISEHYTGILMISELAGNHLSAPNHFWSFTQVAAGNEHFIEQW